MKTTYTFRNYSAIDSDVFDRDLAAKFDTILSQHPTDIDGLVRSYNQVCSQSLDAHAPQTTRARTIRRKPLWFNKAVEEARRVRRRCERRFRKTMSEEDKNDYFVAQKAVSTAINNAKADYYKDKLSDCDSKDMYKIVNELLCKNTRSLPNCNSSSDLANQFCSFFTDKIERIREEIDSAVPTVALPYDTSIHTACTMSSFQEISQEDLKKVIMKCPTKSCDLDPLPTWLMKDHLSTIMPIVCHIVNSSISTGDFPSTLRNAIVTPIIKKTSLDPQQLKHYRPISNLPFLGKLIERVVSSQVASYVNSNNLGEPLQSAYRCAHSTETALLSVQDSFLRAIDNHMAVFLVMIDMSAAFDTVDHQILLQRLSHDFGLSGTVLRWFQSYLSNRSSQVIVSGSASSKLPMKYGVPQGSVIGPQVFTYYSHTIGQIIRSHSLQYHIYADDVHIFLTFDPTLPGDAACALFKLSRCLQELQTWLSSNKLMMNPEKTEFFIAASHAHYKRLQHLTFHLGDAVINPSTSIRNLGAVSDPQMKMNAHVSQPSCSLNFQIRNLCRIRRYLDHNTCNNAVRSLILSRLDYCSSLLNNTSKKNISRLQRIQNRCARLVLKKHRRTHSAPLLKELHWLPVDKRIQFRTLVHSFKSLHNLSPHYISCLLSTRDSSAYFLRSSTTICLQTPKTRTLTGDRAFSSSAPRLWNNLPAMIRSTTNLVSFKKSLKTLLFPK